MFKNYLFTAIRNLKRQFSYSLINISGLAIGLSTFLLLTAWITHELSHDRFHTNADRIYRWSLEYSFGGQTARTAVSPTALLPALMTVPEVESGTRVYNPSAWNPYIIKKGDELFQETRFLVADSTFFDVFSFQLFQGDAKTALTRPYSVVLSETAARKYFPSESAVGKTLLVNNSQEYTVTGVIEDAPHNSILQYDFIGSFSSLRAAQNPPIWWSANYQTFTRLHDNVSISTADEKINAIVAEVVGQELQGQNDYVRYNPIRLTDIYLHSTFDGEPFVLSDAKYVYIFSAVALLILLIACINYVNLSTARAAERAKEVGVRKVVGAFKKQLFTQFIGESLVITFVAFLLAWLFAMLLLPFFNELTGKNFAPAHFMQPQFILVWLMTLIVVAFLAGAYPALTITSFKPVSVLKGRFKTSSRGVWLRQTLVVFQFSVSIVLIAGTLIIARQLSFIQTKKLGYDRDASIVLPLDGRTNEVFETLKTELLRRGAAEYVARGTESPVNVQGGYSIRLSDGNSKGIIITGLLVDEDYVPAMKFELSHGRNFTREDRERVVKDTAYTFILNESAVKTLLLEPEEAVGLRAEMGGRQGEIIGVVKDFHFSSLHKPIGPLVMFPEERQFSKLFVRLTGGDVTSSLRRVSEIYTEVINHRPFEYRFLDDEYGRLYANEQRLSRVFFVFAALAIIIACLGLFGLVAFSASQKTKEIGIRKVMGASEGSIIVLIVRDFARLVLIAIVLGLPISWWLMSGWLESFAYRTNVGVLPLASAAIACLIIAFGSAGYQAVKASLINPASTLRSE